MSNSGSNKPETRTIDQIFDDLTANIVLLFADMEDQKVSPRLRVENEVANALLMTALEANDHSLVQKAISEGANADVDGGKPLRYCAEHDDYALAKLLFFSGADFTIALQKAKKDLVTVPTEYSGQGEWKPKKGHEIDHARTKRLVARLENFLTCCQENIAVQNSMKFDKILDNQARLAEQFAAFRSAVDEITSPLREAKPRDKTLQPMPKG